MKLRRSNHKNYGLTLPELVVVLFALAILIAVLLKVLDVSGRESGMRRTSAEITCVHNLKEISLAYRIWASDHNDLYPMGGSSTNGGMMDWTATGQAFAASVYQVMSNELSTPKILLCPADSDHSLTTNFLTGFSSGNISYFVGEDIANDSGIGNDSNSQRLLGGDDNFEINGTPVKPGFLQLSTNTPLAWTSARHKFNGNVALSDGSVLELSTARLLLYTSSTTNHLAIP